MLNKVAVCSGLQLYSKCTPLYVFFRIFDYIFFEILVKGRRLLTNVIQGCIFDVTGVQDTPLLQKSYTVEQLFAECQFFVEHNLVPASCSYWLFCQCILLYRNQSVDLHSNWLICYNGSLFFLKVLRKPNNLDYILQSNILWKKGLS